MEPDSRIPVRFGDAAEAVPGRAEALLIEAAGADAAAAPMAAGVAAASFALPGPGHAFGCACCLPRGPVAVALGRLFLARVRGEAPFFDAVVAVVRTTAGADAVRAALREDAMSRARFRMDDAGPGPGGLPGTRFTIT